MSYLDSSRMSRELEELRGYVVQDARLAYSFGIILTTGKQIIYLYHLRMAHTAAMYSETTYQMNTPLQLTACIKKHIWLFCNSVNVERLNINKFLVIFWFQCVFNAIIFLDEGKNI